MDKPILIKSNFAEPDKKVVENFQFYLYQTISNTTSTFEHKYNGQKEKKKKKKEKGEEEQEKENVCERYKKLNKLEFLYITLLLFSF
jgi:hypothetical protein